MSPGDLQQRLQQLQRSGATARDPVRFAYLQALARRSEAQPERVRRLLHMRLEQGLSDWLQQHGSDANARPAPATAPALETSEAQSPSDRPLLELLAELAALAGLSNGPQESQTTPAINKLRRSAAPRKELKSLSKFRDSWTLLSASQQLKAALAKAPQNAGPLNSHLLALQSLALMLEISPDYFASFVSYADTLLCLERRETTRKAVRKP